MEFMYLYLDGAEGKRPQKTLPKTIGEMSGHILEV